MSTSLRIEELKKKFDENPRRYFAPLANEYRKAGDLQQAIAICQAHLPQQPGHMSGHIVYGQALFEARQFDQARTVFETALALDPENLIALRYLGDIAFELGDRSGARTWYTRVLETDPRNEEIAALMAAMGDDRGATSREAPTPAAAATRGESDVASKPAGAASREAIADVAASPKAADAAPREPAKPRDAGPSTSAADAELEKLFARPATQQPAASVPPADAAAPQAPPSSFSPLSGFGAPARGESPPALEQRAPSLADESRVPAEPPAPPLPDSALARPTFEAQRGDDSPLQDPPAVAQPAGAAESASRETGFVTETMAELYVKQGFHDRALDVYRQLVAQNPADRALRERMDRVERDARSAVGARLPSAAAAPARPTARGTSGRGPTVRQFLAQIGSRGLTGRGPGVVPPPGGGPRTSGEFRIPPERPPRAPATGSIDALFAGAAPSREDVAAASTLADAFPGGAAGPAADGQIGGRPAHPASTELSLDHVFRDGGAGSGRAASVVSYDQFFSQPSQPGGQGAEEAPAGAAPASGADDIEQFNAWLQGLKKR